MASFTRGPANLDDLLASTLDHYGDGLTEQWVTGSPITKKLFDKHSDELDGGNDIVEHIEYQANGTTGFTSKTGPISTSITPILADARWSFGWLAGSVGIYDYEEDQNKGKEAMLNLLEARVKNVQAKFNVDMETAIGQASTPNANTVWSLPDIVDASNPTLGNFGDIDRATYPFWQATETASGSMAAQGLEDVRTAFYSTSRDMTDPCDLMATTQTLYEAYQARLTPFEVLASNKTGDVEFEHLAFMRKPIFFSNRMASGLFIGINSKYLRLKINKNIKFKNRPFVRAPGGQSKSSVIQLQCQLICTRPASLFKLTGMTA